jgi:hypothetical protein
MDHKLCEVRCLEGKEGHCQQEQELYRSPYQLIYQKSRDQISLVRNHRVKVKGSSLQ